MASKTSPAKKSKLNKGTKSVPSTTFSKQKIDLEGLKRINKTIMDAEELDSKIDPFVPKFGNISDSFNKVKESASAAQTDFAETFSDEETTDSPHTSLLSGSLESIEDTHKFLGVTREDLGEEETLEYEFTSTKKRQNPEFMIKDLLGMLADKGIIRDYYVKDGKCKIEYNRSSSSNSSVDFGNFKTSTDQRYTPDPPPELDKEMNKPIGVKSSVNSSEVPLIDTKSNNPALIKTYKYNTLYGGVVKLAVCDTCMDCPPKVYAERKKWLRHLRSAHPGDYLADIVN